MNNEEKEKLFNSTIDTIRDKATLDKAFVCWTGQVNHKEGHERLHGGHLYLNIVHPSTNVKGEPAWKYKRVSGRQVRKEGSEPFMEWTCSGLLKITKGPRAGKITPLWGLNKGEEYVQVSIDKKLKVSARRDCFNPRKTIDNSLIVALSNLATSLDDKSVRHIESMEEVAPRLHLAVSKTERLFARRSSHALKKLLNITHAEEGMALSDIMNELIQLHGIDSGNSNSAFPYDAVYGAGTVVADLYRTDNLMVLGRWFSLSPDAVTYNNPAEGLVIDGKVIEVHARKITLRA